EVDGARPLGGLRLLATVLSSPKSWIQSVQAYRNRTPWHLIQRFKALSLVPAADVSAVCLFLFVRPHGRGPGRPGGCMRNGVQRIGALVCLLLLAGLPAAAQVSTGEIFGKAADGTGAVLPGVSVTLSGSSLIQPLVAVTTETGAYRFPRIPIGTYTVSFEIAGFKKFVRSDVIIQAGFNAEINARL